jgi:hypothetical protein
VSSSTSSRWPTAGSPTCATSNGKTNHLRTDSDAFVEEIRVLAAAGHGAKIRAELQALDSSFPNDGWATAEKRLAEAGIFAS